ncbi:hypothetical protein CTA1_10128 [Colletotrichum tanaceti]|uniref:Uncharacterized protein n=1 Tax=Colletotrichum tanaceti TaxID=1306861 RepID=A0A4U6X889_9PEZI|nr:hypothetical protein CTA1_10128 [Colletotrichum tanaceti]
MASSDTASEYPVLNEVISIVEPFDKPSNPETWDYVRCPSQNKRPIARCRNQINPLNQQRTKELLAHFKLLKECPATEEFQDPGWTISIGEESEARDQRL